MKLLIIDTTTEAQAFCAKRIESFSLSDIEMLDLKVKLVGEKDYATRVTEADIVILGSGLGERGISLARHSMSLAPWLQIIMFVSEELYSGGAFRAAHAVGVRKVFPDTAGHLDFLQELVGIHSEFRREGRAKEGRIVAVTHAKGGVGATTIAAALGEVCSVFQKKTMLWDFDVETRDLSRALTVNGNEARVVSAWINGSRDVTRESLSEALVQISPEVSVLMPPDKRPESMDLVCHTDSISLVQRVLELSKIQHDCVIVDTGGRLGPATGTILRMADVVLIVIDDTILGLTAVDLFLSFVKPLVGGVDRLIFAVNPYSGALVGISQIAEELEPAHQLGEAPWRLPPIPNDTQGSMWPGTGRTLYSLGSKETRVTLEKMAMELGLIDIPQLPTIIEEPSKKAGWLQKLLGN